MITKLHTYIKNTFSEKTNYNVRPNGILLTYNIFLKYCENTIIWLDIQNYSDTDLNKYIIEKLTFVLGFNKSIFDYFNKNNTRTADETQFDIKICKTLFKNNKNIPQKIINNIDDITFLYFAQIYQFYIDLFINQINTNLADNLQDKKKQIYINNNNIIESYKFILTKFNNYQHNKNPYYRHNKNPYYHNLNPNDFDTYLIDIKDPLIKSLISPKSEKTLQQIAYSQITDKKKIHESINTEVILLNKDSELLKIKKFSDSNFEKINSKKSKEAIQIVSVLQKLKEYITKNITNLPRSNKSKSSSGSNGSSSIRRSTGDDSIEINKKKREKKIYNNNYSKFLNTLDNPKIFKKPEDINNNFPKNYWKKWHYTIYNTYLLIYILINTSLALKSEDILTRYYKSYYYVKHKNYKKIIKNYEIIRNNIHNDNIVFYTFFIIYKYLNLNELKII